MNFKYIANSKVLNDRWLEEVSQELENIIKEAEVDFASELDE